MGFRNPVTSVAYADHAATSDSATTATTASSAMAVDTTGAVSSTPGVRVYPTANGNSSGVLEFRDGHNLPADLELVSHFTVVGDTIRYSDITWTTTGPLLGVRTSDPATVSLATVNGTTPQTTAKIHADVINLDGAVTVKGADAAWITPTLKNAWVAYTGAGYVGVRYRKTNSGQVEVQAMIAGGTIGAGVPAFTLPAGYRPGVEIPTVQMGNNAIGRADFMPNGDVCVVVGSSAAWTTIQHTFTPDQ